MATEKYYLDLYNSPSNSMIDSTMRLYVQDFTAGNSTLSNQRLILVAPLNSTPEISGQNSWEAAGSSFKDLVGEAWAEANEKVAKAKVDTLNLLFGDKGRNNAAIRRSASMVMDSPVKSLKRYAGTEIQVPSTITATYYSSDKNDFKWFEGGYFSHTAADEATGTGDNKGAWITDNQVEDMGNTPLRYIAKKLIPICLGYMNSDEKSEEGTDDIFNVIKLKAPAAYAPPPHKWSPDGTSGTFTLKIGSNIVVTGLLPTSLEIKPSRILTNSNDYYYMTVTISLTQGRQYYSNELIRWIDNTYKDFAGANK